VLERLMSEGHFTRSDIVVCTKWVKRGTGPNDVGLSRKHLHEAVQGSLQRLKLDYVDVALAHRTDDTTPMEEIVRAFGGMVESGKCLYWGTSEWPAVQIERAKHVAARLGLPGPVCEQARYNMLSRDNVEKELEPIHDYWARDGGLGLVTFSPLAYGLLTGKYNDGVPEDSRFSSDDFNDSREKLSTDQGKADIETVRRVGEIAKRLGCTTAQLALRWITLNPRVSCVLLGGSKVEQIIENLPALKVDISSEVQAEIEEILGNKPTPYATSNWATYAPPE
jgi:aryl-alcohol dehydrogenase-like predicted oxidoreductase